MDQETFVSLTQEIPLVELNVEFFGAFCLRENASEEMLKVLMDFYDTATINSVVDFYKESKELFDYQGFDPARLIVHMMKVHKEWEQKNSKIADQIVSELTDTIKIKRSEDFTKEMTILIILFLVRGSNVKKIALKSVTSMAKLIKFYAAKYSIFSREDSKEGSKEVLSPTTVTLARIASCFPMMTVMIFHNDIGRTLAPPLKYFNTHLPRVVLSPGFAAVIPKDLSVDESIHHTVLYINLVNDKIINSNKKRKETSIESLISYHKAAFNSATLSEPLRVQVCTDTKIMVNRRFIKTLKDIEIKAKEYLMKIDADGGNFPITI